VQIPVSSTHLLMGTSCGRRPTPRSPVCVRDTVAGVTRSHGCHVRPADAGISAHKYCPGGPSTGFLLELFNFLGH